MSADPSSRVPIESSRTLLPGVTITLTSAASMALEIVAGRALAPYVGMSLYTWTIVIAVVLAGLSLGHWIGGRIADRTARPERAVAIGLTAAAIASFLCIAALRQVAPFLDGADPLPHIAVLALSAFFLPSLFAGLLSPILTVIALARSAPGRQGSVLGLMFALGAFGAIIGTVLAGLWMISWLGTGASVAVIAATYAVLAIPFWRTRLDGVAAFLTAALAGTAIQWPEAIGLRTACLEESQYFCIRVDPVPGLGRAARVMALDHLAHGVNDKADPSLLLSPYVQGVDELIAARFPGPAVSAFFVGGGAYTLPRAWQDRYPQGQFTIAEIDPAVTAVARTHLWFEPGPGTAIVHADARRVLASLPPDQRFDVIFGDAFHDISIPQHLVTTEFNAMAASRLRPGGVYILNVVDALRTPRFMLSLATTLEQSFPVVELWLDSESIQPVEARATWIVLASDRATQTGQLDARRGFGRTWLRVPLDQMVASVGDERLVILTDDYAPVDRLLAPVLLNADLSEARP